MTHVHDENRHPHVPSRYLCANVDVNSGRTPQLRFPWVPRHKAANSFPFVGPPPRSPHRVLLRRTVALCVSFVSVRRIAVVRKGGSAIPAPSRWSEIIRGPRPSSSASSWSQGLLSSMLKSELQSPVEPQVGIAKIPELDVGSSDGEGTKKGPKSFHWKPRSEPENDLSKGHKKRVEQFNYLQGAAEVQRFEDSQKVAETRALQVAQPRLPPPPVEAIAEVRRLQQIVLDLQRQLQGSAVGKGRTPNPPRSRRSRSRWQTDR